MSIVEKIFPKQCLICSRIGFEICPKCLVKIPHSLPSCCICNNINNNYLTHRYCTDLSIQCFTGWYISKEIKYKLQRKKDLQIYSVHKFLLNTLINYLSISELTKSSTIYALPTNELKSKRLNTALARSLKRGKGDGLLFVGGEIESIEFLKKEKGLLLKKSPHLQVLTLFTQTPRLQVPLE